MLSTSTSAVFDTIPGRSGSHAPTLTTLPDGALLAAWFSYEGPHELQGASIYIARRRPNEAWSPPRLLLESNIANANPVLYAEGDRAWLFYAAVRFGWSSASIEFIQSGDAGDTWSAPRSIPGPIGSNVRFQPIRLSSGELLLPAYDDLLQRSLFFASDDGRHWSLRSILEAGLPSSNIQPTVVERGDGSLLAVMRNSQSGGLWASQSNDGGRTWTDPVESTIPNPASPAQLLRLRSGALLLIFNNDPARRCPLSAARSDDDGTTWSAAQMLLDCEGEFAYPAAAGAADGIVHILYSHDRAFIGHIEIETGD